MSFIHLTTFISAPQERVFDLSRSIDLHRRSMSGYQEQAINGRISGLIEENETVTWKAKHLFKERVLQVKVTGMKRPDYFVDEQVQGNFRLMKHEHYFKPVKNGTLMIDQFRFETPYGILGSLLERLYLEKYVTRLLTERNEMIRKVAESNQWKQYLHDEKT